VGIREPLAAQDVDAAERAEFDAIIDGRLIHSAYQPIVELESESIVGWEALARGPSGSLLEFPDRLFALAAMLGRTAELDFVCRVAAVEGALVAGLGIAQELLINVEASAATSVVPEFASAARAVAHRELRITVEITERLLMDNPAELITALVGYRELGWGVALDDVGVDPGSVGLIPFVRPDVIKLDKSLVQQPITRSQARTVHAYVAEAERSGTRILAEGIETAEHLDVARVLGAELGQGWYFGRPGLLRPVPVQTNGTGRIPNRSSMVDPLEATPFEVLRRVRPVRRGTKRQLLEISLALEDEAIAQGETSVLLSTFQEAAFFTPATKERYASIASRAAFVGALAQGLGEQPAPGVRGVALDSSDALGKDWTVVVIGPHFAGAFAARDLEVTGVPDGERPFEFAITYDRDLVTAAAVRLMQRLARSAS
jgi:EAL domain-containing protein (putative c-di-GMP-specific phosphodiesterase class I)